MEVVAVCVWWLIYILPWDPAFLHALFRKSGSPGSSSIWWVWWKKLGTVVHSRYISFCGSWLSRKWRIVDPSFVELNYHPKLILNIFTNYLVWGWSRKKTELCLVYFAGSLQGRIILLCSSMASNICSLNWGSFDYLISKHNQLP